MLQAERVKEEDTWRKFRIIAYEVWRKGTKSTTSIDAYMPIGIDRCEITSEELDDIWQKYGKLKRGKRWIRN